MTRPVLIFMVVLTGCAQELPQQEILRPVRSQQVYATGGARVRSFSGMARAGRETDLSFRVSGRIEELNVEVGDAVRAGHLIARLEPRDFEIAQRQAEANLAQSQARSRNEEANLDRIRGLYENDNASKNDLDAALAQSQAARAQVDASTQALESARRRLEYTRLRAPVNGAIAAVPVEVNENVERGQQVVRMTSGSSPEVVVAMPGVLISQVREGEPVTVRFDALADAVFEAVVTEVGVAAIGTATTFPVTVRLAQADPDIRSGMAAEVAFRFASRDSRERIYLPTHAVGEDREGRYVFVLEAGPEDGVGRVRRVAVEVGALTPDGLELLAGLTDGQHVVTAGVRRLTDGQRVKLLDSAGESR
jgi:RND family efflux transporter MFP subunit